MKTMSSSTSCRLRYLPIAALAGVGMGAGCSSESMNGPSSAAITAEPSTAGIEEGQPCPDLTNTADPVAFENAVASGAAAVCKPWLVCQTDPTSGTATCVRRSGAFEPDGGHYGQDCGTKSGTHVTGRHGIGEGQPCPDLTRIADLVELENIVASGSSAECAPGLVCWTDPATGSATCVRAAYDSIPDGGASTAP
jgi:hypothetical protein